MDDQGKLEENDHRRLGQELDLFVMSPLVGSGLPLFTPRGTVLRDELAKYSNELREMRGFQKVWSPHLTKTELYKASGHWDKFGDELFLVKSQETKDEMVMKPMNCPHHMQIYASRPRSYRELPIKYLETTTIYRDEKSGELQGLSRVRSVTQDDSHAFCSLDQITDIAKELVEAAQELYEKVGMKLSYRLSFRDNGDGYLGDKDLWDKAQKLIEEMAKAEKLNYEVAEGEAAFYGPKIDFMAEDVLGRVWQVATVQLDFVQPERFELAYTDEQGNNARPVVVHCALLGSIERFLAVYIEHTSGRFPVWLAPEQLRVATLNDDKAVMAKAQAIVDQAVALGIRAALDDSNESVGKKIAEAERMKVPYVIVVGTKEVEGGEVTPRYRSDLGEGKAQPVEDFLAEVAAQAESRSK